MAVALVQSEISEHLLSLHRLLLRLQQRNKFVGFVEHTSLSPLETHLILEIQAEPGLPISTYAHRLMVEISLCTRITQKFVQRGFIVVRASTFDLRRKEVLLTPKGVALIATIDEFANQVVSALRAGQTKRSWGELVRFFSMLADAGGVPRAPKRPQEDEYRVQQRRITRLLGLLGNFAWGTSLTSSEIQILTEVCHAPLPPRITELAELLGLQPHSTGEVISKFEAGGLLRKKPFEGDGRVSVVVATPKGRRSLREAEERACALLSKAAREFTLSQLKQLIRILEHSTRTVDLFWPMLPLSLRLDYARSERQKRLARGFVARVYVELGIEESLPERLLPEDHELFLIYRDTELVGMICTENRAGVLIAPHLCASPQLPPWSLAAAWGEVVRLTSSLPSTQLRAALADATAGPSLVANLLRSLSA